MFRPLAIPIALLTFLLLSAGVRAARLDIPAIDRATGSKGNWVEREKVYRLDFARERAQLAGFGSWAAFKTGNEFPAIMMGELALLRHEVQPAISAAVENGLSVTSLHAATLDDGPRVYAMHVAGEGTAEQLATGVRKTLDAARGAKLVQASAGLGDGPSSISPEPLDAIFGGGGAGRGGEAKDGTYHFAVGREVAMPCACTAAGSMGVASWATFRGGDDAASVRGAIACTYKELQPVLRALRGGNGNGAGGGAGGSVEIVAITNHMDAEAPRLIFAHFQANGRAADIAKTIKAAMDSQKRGAVAPGAHDNHQHHNH